MKQLFFIALFLLSALCRAENGQVYIVLSEETPLYNEASRKITESLTQANDVITVSSVSIAKFKQMQFTADDLIVPLGESAGLASQHVTNPSVLYSLIERQAIMHPATQSWAAVVIDQPITRLLAVARQVVKNRYHDNIIVAVSADNQPLINEISALDSSMKPQLLIIEANQEPAKEVDKVLFGAGALLAVRDDRIWSGENAKWMLYQSFKYRVPVIGYSKKFLQAGALASVYVTLSQTTDKTVELILDWHHNQYKLTHSGIIYPDYNTEYNAHIARSLNLPLPADDK